MLTFVVFTLDFCFTPVSFSSTAVSFSSTAPAGQAEDEPRQEPFLGPGHPEFFWHQQPFTLLLHTHHGGPAGLPGPTLSWLPGLSSARICPAWTLLLLLEHPGA